MRGPKTSYPIELTEKEVEGLQRVVRAHTTGQSLAMRARIVRQPMSTRNGVISRLHRPLAPAIGKCASGEHVGKAPRAWPTRPVRERRGVFPHEVGVQATAVACSLRHAQGVPLASWGRARVSEL